jgi:hypothetical protein
MGPNGPYVIKEDFAELPSSVLLSNFVGLDEVKVEKNEQEIRLRFNSTELSLLFHDEELLYKFTGTLLSAVNSLNYRMH